jgi:hypothetical protein
VDLGRFEEGGLLQLRQIVLEAGFSHDTLRPNLTRLERQGIAAEASSKTASTLPLRAQRGMNTIFNH